MQANFDLKCFVRSRIVKSLYQLDRNNRPMTRAPPRSFRSFLLCTLQKAILLSYVRYIHSKKPSNSDQIGPVLTNHLTVLVPLFVGQTKRSFASAAKYRFLMFKTYSTGTRVFHFFTIFEIENAWGRI